MKLYSKIYGFIGVVIICYFCLIYYWRKPFSESNRDDLKQIEDSAQHAATSLPKTKPVDRTIFVGEGEPQGPAISDGFSGIQLLSQMGSPVSIASLEVLQKSGDLLELQAAALEPGGKTYGLGIHSGGGVIVNLGKDDALLALSILSKAGVATSDEELSLLADFTLLSQPTVTVLDEKFETADMQIQMFQSKTPPKTHVLIYSHGGTRSLVFFDSSRVEMEKLLPASPDTMDPATLKQLRSMVEPAK